MTIRIDKFSLPERLLTVIDHGYLANLDMNETEITEFRVPMWADVKVGLSPSKKNCFVCFIESPLKMMKNAFYFSLKALFVCKMFKFLSWHFGHLEKTA